MKTSLSKCQIVTLFLLLESIRSVLSVGLWYSTVQYCKPAKHRVDCCITSRLPKISKRACCNTTVYAITSTPRHALSFMWVLDLSIRANMWPEADCLPASAALLRTNPRLLKLPPYLSFLCIAIGVAWLLILPLEDYSRRTYISENALLPGQVHTYFAGSDQNVFRGYKHEVDALGEKSNIEYARCRPSKRLELISSQGER